jgi:hypothetical protein
MHFSTTNITTDLNFPSNYEGIDFYISITRVRFESRGESKKNLFYFQVVSLMLSLHLLHLALFSLQSLPSAQLPSDLCAILRPALPVPPLLTATMALPRTRCAWYW